MKTAEADQHSARQAVDESEIHLMKFLVLLFVALITATSVFTQEEPKGLTAASKAYHDYRLTETEPSFEKDKVLDLIEHIKPTEGTDVDNFVLATKTYNALSIRAKFTYCMIHGEVSSQICDIMPGILDEEKKIFAEPLDAFGNEQDWSKRQLAFLHSHRREVIGLLRSTIISNNRVGVNLKKAIVELDAYELIPDMVTIFNKAHRDQDILSVFCVLMKSGNCPPFLKSITCQKLYGKASDYQSFIVGNAANQQLTIKRAMAYYKSRKS